MPPPAMSIQAQAGDESPPLMAVLSRWPHAVLLVRGERVRFANDAAACLFATEPQALLDRTPSGLLHADEDHEADGARPDPLGRRTIHRADGTTREVDASVIPVDDMAGQPSGATTLVVLQDVTELRQARADLMRSHEVHRRLAAGLDAAQENERQRIAHELHDELQQTLAAIGLELAAIRERLQAGAVDATERIDTTSKLAMSVIASTRRIINDLRPPILEELGLAAALEALVDQMAVRNPDLHWRFQAEEGADAALAPVVVTTLYRTAQEALNNVARHAGASAVAVQLQRHGDGQILLRIGDNGRGMAIDDRRRPFTVGLLSMRERLRAVGGALRLESQLGTGTTVEAIAPDTLFAMAPTRPLAQDDPRGPDDVLLRFLYRAPVGLVQTLLDGQIEMINPMAAQLLMPCSPDGRLDNLFTVLKDAVPHLSRLSAHIDAPSGVVCESLHVQLAPQGRHHETHAFSLNVLKQGGERLMAVLSAVKPVKQTDPAH